MKPSLNEKVAGAIFGYAIGDALGLGTEFMSRREIMRRYPDTLTDYDQIIRDAHRSQFVRGGVSNDTRAIGLLIRSIEAKGKLDFRDVAERMKRWYDGNPSDMLSHIKAVVSWNFYTSDPINTSKETWQRMAAIAEPYSDALGRSLIAGMWGEDIQRTSQEICEITHYNSRCVSTANVIAQVAYALLWEDRVCSPEELCNLVKDSDPELIPFIKEAAEGPLNMLRLDDEEESTQAHRALMAALWALWHCENPDDALIKIVNEGGDADTNASLATALVAMRYGVKAISPKYINELAEHDQIEAIADVFTKLLKKKFN